MRNFTEIFNDEHIELLRHQLLFSGLSNNEIYIFILHAKPLYLHIKKGESVMIAEKYGHMIGLVYQGSVNVYSIEYDGSKTLLNLLSKGAYSSMIYAVYDYSNALIEFTASEDSDILLINPEALFIGEKNLALIQQKILANMIASQRLALQRLSDHLSCVSQRSIKNKVLRLLGFFSTQQHSNEFEIPFSREELANYLAVDRAALSRTLGDLKRQKIIDFRKSHFILLKPELCRKVTE